MDFRPLSNCRRLALLLLLTLSLMGVQLLQGSVLHDHQQHTVDCALCHFQLSDDTEFSPQPALASTVAHHRLVTAAASPALFQVPSPYHSRAPPHA